MKRLFATFFSTAAALACAQAPATVGVASFNMAWAGTDDDFLAHQKVCQAVKYCDTRPRRERGQTEATPEAVAVAKQCEADTRQAAGGFAAQMQLAPCSAYFHRDWRQPHTLAQHQEKLASLRTTVGQIIQNQGVQVIAFQEVKSAATLRQVLGPHAAEFEVCVAPHNAFQTVGFAWKKSLSSTPGVCQDEQALAVVDDPDGSGQATGGVRRVRPGLALELTVGGERISFLNVHLKAACANLLTDGRFEGNKLTDNRAACVTLGQQVAPLEAWIDRVATRSPRLVWLGDFNRKIHEEAASVSGAVRTDGSDPTSPPTTQANGRTTSQYLWQEVADGRPVALHQVPLAGKDAGCTGFDGLDHIVLSQAVLALQPSAPTSRKVANHSSPNQAMETSDHCPRVVQLKL
jgi:endonuclease/exonuclease/phosphatase family metal-dependent hydrolase